MGIVKKHVAKCLAVRLKLAFQSRVLHVLINGRALLYTHWQLLAFPNTKRGDGGAQLSCFLVAVNLLEPPHAIEYNVNVLATGLL